MPSDCAALIECRDRDRSAIGASRLRQRDVVAAGQHELRPSDRGIAERIAEIRNTRLEAAGRRCGDAYRLTGLRERDVWTTGQIQGTTRDDCQDASRITAQACRAR